MHYGDDNRACSCSDNWQWTLCKQVSYAGWLENWNVQGFPQSEINTDVYKICARRSEWQLFSRPLNQLYAESFGNDASETIDVSAKQTAQTHTCEKMSLFILLDSMSVWFGQAVIKQPIVRDSIWLKQLLTQLLRGEPSVSRGHIQMQVRRTSHHFCQIARSGSNHAAAVWAREPCRHQCRNDLSMTPFVSGLAEPVLPQCENGGLRATAPEKLKRHRKS